MNVYDNITFYYYLFHMIHTITNKMTYSSTSISQRKSLENLYEYIIYLKSVYIKIVSQLIIYIIFITTIAKHVDIFYSYIFFILLTCL